MAIQADPWDLGEWGDMGAQIGMGGMPGMGALGGLQPPGWPQARAPQAQAPAGEEGEEQGNQNVSTSRKILESELLSKCEPILRNLREGKDISVYSGVICPFLQLFSIILHDIPTCIPELVTSGFINILFDTLSIHVPKHTDFMTCCLKAINAVCLHNSGEEVIASYKLIEKLFWCYLDPEYTKYIVSPNNPDSIRDHVVIFFQINSHAKAGLKSQVLEGFNSTVGKLRDMGEELTKRMGKEIRGLRSEGEESKLPEGGKIGQYLAEMKLTDQLQKEKKNFQEVLRNALSLFYSFMRDEESRMDHDFLMLINGKGSLGKQLLYLLNITIILGQYNKTLKRAIPTFHNFFKRIIYDFNNEEQNVELFKEIWMNLQEASNLLGPLSRLRDLHEFCYESREIKSNVIDPIIGQFPRLEQLPIILGYVESYGEIVKFMSTTKDIQLEFQSLLTLLADLQALLLRELIGCMRAKNTVKDRQPPIVPKDRLKAYCKVILSALGDKTDIFELCGAGVKGEWEVMVLNTYATIKKVILYVSKGIQNRRRIHNHESSTVTQNLQTVAKSLIIRIKEFSLGYLQRTSLYEIDKLGVGDLEELRYFLIYSGQVLIDLACILTHEQTQAKIILHFFTDQGYNYLFQFLSWLVPLSYKIKELEREEEREIKVEVESRRTEEEKKEADIQPVDAWTAYQSNIGAILMIILKAMDPDSPSFVLSLQNTDLQGYFSSQTSFISNLISNLMDKLLYKINYGVAGNPIHFFSQYSHPGFVPFELFLRRVYKKFPVLSKLKSGHAGRGASEVPPELVEQLIIMGFNRERAIEALEMKEFNMDAAINYLINNPAKGIGKLQLAIPGSSETNMFESPSILLFDSEEVPECEITEKKIVLPGIEFYNKIEKDMGVEQLSKQHSLWISSLQEWLFECIYPVSMFKCRYLIINLVNSLSLPNSPNLLQEYFLLTMYELSMLMTSIHIDYPINIPLTEKCMSSDFVFADYSISHKLRHKLNDYPSLNEDIALTLDKVRILLDTFITFIKSEKRCTGIMYEMGYYRDLVSLLNVLLMKEHISLTGRLLPKVLMLVYLILSEGEKIEVENKKNAEEEKAKEEEVKRERMNTNMNTNTNTITSTNTNTITNTNIKTNTNTNTNRNEEPPPTNTETGPKLPSITATLSAALSSAGTKLGKLAGFLAPHDPPSKSTPQANTLDKHLEDPTPQEKCKYVQVDDIKHIHLFHIQQEDLIQLATILSQLIGSINTMEADTFKVRGEWEWKNQELKLGKRRREEEKGEENQEGEIGMMDTEEDIGKAPETVTVLTDDGLSILLVILCHITQSFTVAEHFLQVGGLHNLLALRRSYTRSTINEPLLNQLMMNLIESGIIVSEMLERIIKNTLYAQIPQSLERQAIQTTMTTTVKVSQGKTRSVKKRSIGQIEKERPTPPTKPESPGANTTLEDIVGQMQKKTEIGVSVFLSTFKIWREKHPVMFEEVMGRVTEINEFLPLDMKNIDMERIKKEGKPDDLKYDASKSKLTVILKREWILEILESRKGVILDMPLSVSGKPQASPITKPVPSQSKQKKRKGKKETLAPGSNPAPNISLSKSDPIDSKDDQGNIIQTNNLKKYRNQLHSAMRQCGHTLPKAGGSDLVSILLEQLMKIYKADFGEIEGYHSGEEIEDGWKEPIFLIDIKCVLNLLLVVFRAYPETISILLKPRLTLPNNTTIITYLVRVIFPLHYMKREVKTETNSEDSKDKRANVTFKLKENGEGAKLLFGFLRGVIIENSKLMSREQIITIREVRRLFLSEMLAVLIDSLTTKGAFLQFHTLAILYSTLTLWDLLFATKENTILAPIYNQFNIIHSVLEPKDHPLPKLALDILRNVREYIDYID